MPTDARAEIEARLRAVATRLVMRHAARAAFGALGGASIALCLGLLFLDGLPRLLFGVSAGLWALAGVGIAGLIAGAWWELRRFAVPSMQDAALSMEARLGNDTGALASILRLSPDNVFASPVTTRAHEELLEAESSPGPNVVSTRRLIVVPVLALVAGVGLALAISADAPQGVASDNSGQSKVAGNWAAVDVGGSRSDSDWNALQDALNLQKTAANLNTSAATIRDAGASTAERQTALDNANAEVAEMPGELSSGEALPTTLPESEADRADLADRFENLATRAAGAAKAVEDGAGGTSDSRANGEFETTDTATVLVPFPPMATARTNLPAEALAAQTPARRALAERAVQAYERIQNP